jgi:hypothetical protein
VAVTIVDREGIAVTLVLRPADLATYTSFQAAVLRATGSPFRYLPDTGPLGSLAAQPLALTRLEGHRLADVLHTLTTVPYVLKNVIKRVLLGSNVVSAE